jgi:hypothetical protein
VLGVAVVVLIASIVIGGITRAILSFILPTFLDAWLGSLVSQCITTPFVALAFTVMYFQLARGTEPQPGAEPAAA